LRYVRVSPDAPAQAPARIPETANVDI